MLMSASKQKATLWCYQAVLAIALLHSKHRTASLQALAKAHAVRHLVYVLQPSAINREPEHALGKPLSLPSPTGLH